MTTQRESKISLPPTFGTTSILLLLAGLAVILSRSFVISILCWIRPHRLKRTFVHVSHTHLINLYMLTVLFWLESGPADLVLTGTDRISNTYYGLNCFISLGVPGWKKFDLGLMSLPIVLNMSLN